MQASPTELKGAAAQLAGMRLTRGCGSVGANLVTLLQRARKFLTASAQILHCMY